MFNKIAICALLFGLAPISTGAPAQLPAGNAQGVRTGHVHLTVADAAAARTFWTELGAEETASGSLPLLKLPGMFIILTEREPIGPSNGSTVNHIAFLIQDYGAYQEKMAEANASFILDNADTGQMLADLPGGLRLEFQRDDSITRPIQFHHIHMATQNGEELRDWYVRIFGAEASSRRNMPSAVVPGGQLDFLGSPTPTEPTRGRAIDHIGFEVDDLDAFAERLRAEGVEFNMEPRTVERIGLKIAFITDPMGTYIELTEGLDAH